MEEPWVQLQQTLWPTELIGKNESLLDHSTTVDQPVTLKRLVEALDAAGHRIAERYSRSAVSLLCVHRCGNAKLTLFKTFSL